MISSKAEALGIIFPNSYDSLVPDLVSERLMASIPFASRYRMCDFMISSMVHNLHRSRSSYSTEESKR